MEATVTVGIEAHLITDRCSTYFLPRLSLFQDLKRFNFTKLYGIRAREGGYP